MAVLKTLVSPFRTTSFHFPKFERSNEVCIIYTKYNIYIYIHIECVWVSSKSCSANPTTFDVPVGHHPSLQKNQPRSCWKPWEKPVDLNDPPPAVGKDTVLDGLKRVDIHSCCCASKKWQLLHVLRFQGRCLRVLLGNAPEQFLDGDDSSPASKLWDDDTVSAHFFNQHPVKKEPKLLWFMLDFRDLKDQWLVWPFATTGCHESWELTPPQKKNLEQKRGRPTHVGLEDGLKWKDMVLDVSNRTDSYW